MKKQLTLDQVRPPLPFNINYGMGDISLHRTLRDEFDFNVYLPSIGMNLQRDLVWTDFQKEQLIISILKGIKIPVISVLKSYLDEDRNYIYQVIDGKQRLTTLLDFIEDKFAINWGGEQYFFSDFHSYLKSDLYNCIRADIGFDYHYDRVSDQDKITWFERINFAGTPQDLEHINKLKQS